MEMLLERESVLAQLGVLGQQAGRGAGQVVLLRGEAGVGKTAVIRRFIAGLDERVRVLRGWCDSLAMPQPLGPLIDMLTQLPKSEAAGLAAALDRGGAGAIYATLLGLFGDGNSWVCAVEDLHWADQATLDVLWFLARRVGSLPVLLLVSYRDDEVGAQRPFAAALGEVATCQALTRIGLARLSRDAVAVLAAGSNLNADELHRVTGGNPFFVTEILGRTPRPRCADTSAGPHRLTRRERDVLELLSAGGSDADIATTLCISPKTASNHVSAILTKLGVHNRTQAAAYALNVRDMTREGLDNPFPSAEADEYDGIAVGLGEQFAKPAAVSVNNAQLLASARARVQRLQDAVATKAMIDQAIGILRCRDGGSSEEALVRLQRISQSENVKIAVAAQQLVDEAVRRARARHCEG
jgi:DNA-binding NarL/FixJ family response regulator